MPEPIKDVTNPDPNPTAANPAEPAQGAAPAIADANTDAIEVGNLLLGSGYTKDQINQLLEAPRALEALRYAIKNDPVEFVRSLERADPGAGENFYDKLTKEYVERYDRPGAAPGAAPANGGAKDAPNTELFDKVRELTEEVGRFKNQAQARDAAAADAQMAARYHARVDDLFSQIPKDKFPLEDYEVGLIKDALSSRLAADPQAVARVKMGNFVDVPNQFKGVLDSIARGRQAKADAETKARERATNAMFPTFEGGPMELPKEFTTLPESNSPDDIWDVGGLVKALEATGSR